MTLPPDEFRGDNTKLVGCIEALIELSDAGKLVPHGMGGHARGLLAAAANRLTAAALSGQRVSEPVAVCGARPDENLGPRFTAEEWHRLGQLPEGTKLYTAPPTAIPDGIVVDAARFRKLQAQWNRLSTGASNRILDDFGLGGEAYWTFDKIIDHSTINDDAAAPGSAEIES